MLETLKKKWWLVAIVVVIGGVLLNNSGVLNKSLEKTLKSENAWAVKLTDPTSSSDNTMTLYAKFVGKDVYLGQSAEEAEKNSEDADAMKKGNMGNLDYTDNNSAKISIDVPEFKEKIGDGSITLKVDDLKATPLNGKLVVNVSGVEMSMPTELTPAK